MRSNFSTWLSIVGSGVIAAGFAFLLGIAGGMAGIYLYDRGMSKGDDLAVGLIGFHAVGTFGFIILFSWINRSRRKISWFTPYYALVACLFGAMVTTMLFWDSNDRYYKGFVSAGWIIILLCALGAVLVSRYFLVSPK